MEDTDKDAGKEASADDIAELMALSNISTSDAERDPDEECEIFTVFLFIITIKARAKENTYMLQCLSPLPSLLRTHKYFLH